MKDPPQDADWITAGLSLAMRSLGVRWGVPTYKSYQPTLKMCQAHGCDLRFLTIDFERLIPSRPMIAYTLHADIPPQHGQQGEQA